MIHINYTGKSKVILRLCWAVNWLSEHAAGNMHTNVYDTNQNGIVDNAEKVNSHNVYKDVPSDAVFTDTIYDDTAVRGQIRANMNNIELLMNTLFHANVHWLIDSGGHQIIDSNGYPIYTAQYTSQLDQIQNQILLLQQRLDDLGLSVADGMLQVTYEERRR